MGRCNSNAKPTRATLSRSGSIARIDSTEKPPGQGLVEHAGQIGSLVASTSDQYLRLCCSDQLC